MISVAEVIAAGLELIGKITGVIADAHAGKITADEADAQMKALQATTTGYRAADDQALRDKFAAPASPK